MKIPYTVIQRFLRKNGAMSSKSNIDFDDTGEVPKSKKIETSIFCPICDDIVRFANFWGHLNNSHIARNVWADVSLLRQHH